MLSGFACARSSSLGWSNVTSFLHRPSHGGINKEVYWVDEVGRFTGRAKEQGNLRAAEDDAIDAATEQLIHGLACDAGVLVRRATLHERDDRSVEAVAQRRLDRLEGDASDREPTRVDDRIPQAENAYALPTALLHVRDDKVGHAED